MKTLKQKTRILLSVLAIILCSILPGQVYAADTTPTAAPISDGLSLQDGRYVLYVKGTQVSSPGWQTLPEQKFQIGPDGHVSARMEETNGIWRAYSFNADTTGWDPYKDAWVVADSEYYFDQTGRCVKIYDPASKKCSVYSSKKMALVKKDICTLRNGKTYLFNAKGIRVSQPGWQKLSADRLIQTTKTGIVLSRMEKTNGLRRSYRYDQTLKKWQLQKKIWLTVDKKKYYFNASGTCTRMYNTVTQKCCDCKNGKMTVVKKATRDIDGKRCYFGASGKKVSSAGLYLTSSKKLVYALANGHVTKQISGKVLDYASVNGKVTKSRVRSSHYMCYYNAKGTLKRKIDLNKKMVALTYDDGPSQYTPIILDVLKRNNSVATFFVVGDRIPYYPSAVKQTCDMGCEIGNHTQDHTILTSVNVPTIQNQVNATNTAVKNMTGTSPVVMRPPGGGYNATVQNAVGMPLIMWSIDTLDWKTLSAPATQAAVLNNVQDGDVVLMHDLHGPTAEASKTIIPELVQRGYQLVTVSELADCRGAMKKGGVYYSWH